MSQNHARIIENDYFYETWESYQTNPQSSNYVIDGYFPKENTKKEMAIRQINTTLTALLGVALFIMVVGYYFATANEMKLNNLNRQTVILNDENSDLQNKLDKLKSFNNVDLTMQKNNMLQKAQQVMEIPAVSSNVTSHKKIDAQKPFTWAIGY